jgi:hypothetical protein
VGVYPFTTHTFNNRTKIIKKNPTMTIHARATELETAQTDLENAHPYTSHTLNDTCKNAFITLATTACLTHITHTTGPNPKPHFPYIEKQLNALVKIAKVYWTTLDRKTIITGEILETAYWLAYEKFTQTLHTDPTNKKTITRTMREAGNLRYTHPKKPTPYTDPTNIHWPKVKAPKEWVQRVARAVALGQYERGE